VFLVVFVSNEQEYNKHYPLLVKYGANKDEFKGFLAVFRKDIQLVFTFSHLSHIALKFSIYMFYKRVLQGACI